MGLDKYKNKAEEELGQQVDKRALLFVFLVTGSITLLILLLTKNAMVLLAGIFIGMYLPWFLLERKRKNTRYRLISKLTDPLRLIISRLPEQENITRVIESTLVEIEDKRIRELFSSFVSDISLGMSVRDALANMQKEVSLRKFDVFAQNLVQAHYEGFTLQARKALDKAVEAIELDLRAVEKVREQSKNKKRKLYISLGTVWFFPLILSLVNTNEQNVYFSTLPGKLLILIYVISTVFIYVKGEEYLSINLEDL